MGSADKTRDRLRCPTRLPLTVSLLLLAAWAMVPYGSVTPWAQAILVCGTLVIAMAVAVDHACRTQQNASPSPRALHVLLLLLAAWLAWQYWVLLKTPAPRAAFLLKLSFLASLGAATWSTRRLCSNRRCIITLFSGIALIGTAQATIGFLGLHTDLGRYQSSISSRAAGTFSSGNSFGGFVAIALITTLGLTAATLPGIFRHIARRKTAILHVSTREDYRIFLALGLMLILTVHALALLLSGSRGGTIAGGLALLIGLLWGLRYAQSSKSGGRVTLIVVAVLITITALGVGGTYAVAAKRFSALSDASEASMPRTVMWRGVLKMIGDNPLGTGLGSFPARFPQYQPPGYGTTRTRHAHNDYLEIIAELGIPGAMLLFALLAVLLIQMGPYLLQHHGGESIWLRRCALLAVVTGLIHAVVDFNLWSRPAVSLLFAILLGAAISSPDGRARGKSVQARNQNTNGHSIGPRLVPLCIFILLLAPLAFLGSKAAVASVLAERGFQGLGASPERYFWLKPKSITNEQAVAAIEKAARIHPANPDFHVMRAQAELQAHRVKLTTLSARMQASIPSLAPDLIEQQVTIALRLDETRMLKSTEQHLNTALGMDPDSVDANAHWVRTLGALTQLSPSKDAYHSRLAALIQGTSKARALAPNDVSLHRLVFEGIQKAAASGYARDERHPQSTIQDLLMNVGQHLMWLSQNEANRVLEGWQGAGIPLSRALHSPTLPLDVIKKVYEHYNRDGDGISAMIALDKLKEALADASLSRPGFSTVERERKLRLALRHMAVRESARWALRSRDFATYTEAFNARQETLERHEAASSEALLSQWKRTGLSTGQTLRLLKHTARTGASRSRIDSLLAPLMFFGNEATRKEAAHVLKANHPDGDLAMDRFLQSAASSVSAKHRVKLLEAQRHLTSGNTAAARTAIEDARLLCPNDPDILSFLSRNEEVFKLTVQERASIDAAARSISPDHHIGMQMLGGRAELTGVTLRHDLMTCVWRFRGEVPADLESLWMFRDPGGNTTHSKRIRFSKTETLDFGSGSPRLGMSFLQNYPLSTKKPLGANFVIALRRRSSGRWLTSSEGLPYCEVYDWKALLHDTPPEVQTELVEATALIPPIADTSLETLNRLPRSRYKSRKGSSHNLHRVFTTEQFFPLLDGKRQTTPHITWQPCLSAPGIVETAVAAARSHFELKPDALTFSLAINDGEDWCQCAACRKLLPASQHDLPADRRWWSEPYWRFVDTVAKQIKLEHPGKRISALAYANVALPPSFKLEDNITVFVCEDAGAHFDDARRNFSRQQLEAWVNVCSDIGRYGYAGLVSWIFPRYCRDELANDIRTASDLGITQFYIENFWVEWIDGPLPWIVKMMLEDPRRNPKRLQAQFCQSVFGPAGPTMDAYYDYLQSVWQSAPNGVFFDGLFNIEKQASRYTPDVRKTMQGFITKANTETANAPTVQAKLAAVTGPLQIAFAFAEEADIIRELRDPFIVSSTSFRRSEAIRDLRVARQHREETLKGIAEQPWGASLRRALQASHREPTIERWNRNQDELIASVENQILVFQNVMRSLRKE
jgi:O-antigen ligase